MYFSSSLPHSLHQTFDVQPCPSGLFLPDVSLLTHLSVEQGVVVPPHLWVNIVEVPLKAFTLQFLPQRNPRRDVSVINTVVLQEHKESLREAFALLKHFFRMNS